MFPASSPGFLRNSKCRGAKTLVYTNSWSFFAACTRVFVTCHYEFHESPVDEVAVSPFIVSARLAAVLQGDVFQAPSSSG